MTVDRSDQLIMLESIPSLGRQVPMLRWLDPHGDTIYNVIQRRILIEEISSATPENDDDRAVFTEIIRMCRAITRPHRYLWFIGD